MATDQSVDLGELELDCIGTVGVYAKKYFSLRKKCEQIQQSNEKLVNRLYHVKRMVKKHRKERKLLSLKLEEYGDDFYDAGVPTLWEGTDPALVTIVPVSENIDMTSPLESQASTSHLVPAPAPLTPTPIATTPSPSKSKKSRGEKPERDVNAPKKPANAFLKFCQQQRQNVQEQYKKEEGEDITHAELTRRLAVLWNALPQEKKNVYYELYEQEKEKYEQELEAYTGTKESPLKAAASEMVHQNIAVKTEIVT